MYIFETYVQKAYRFPEGGLCVFLGFCLCTGDRYLNRTDGNDLRQDTAG